MQKSSKEIDPFRDVSRILDMNASTHTLQSLPQPATLADGGPGALWGGKMSGFGKLSVEQKSQNSDWIAEMLRVRDQKDRKAFAALFTHFAPRIKGFLIKSGADAAMAEECAQDVMTTLWHKSEQFDPTRASVATWIFTIARNRRIDMLRRQRRPEPEELTWGPEPEPDQADTIALMQETEQLKAAMIALPDAQRELIEKAYFGDLSQAEIAKITGLPLGTIKSRIRLALDRLRHAMN